jgi:membrane associated rhomboid family serine protease
LKSGGHVWPLTTSKSAGIPIPDGIRLDGLVRVWLVVVLTILGFIVGRAMTPEERKRVIRSALEAVADRYDRWLRGRKRCAPFRDAIRARTPWIVAMPILVGLSASVLAWMWTQGAAFDAPGVLVQWGGNFAPRTTNGEWWRLVVSMFVHAGVFRFLINCVGFTAAALIAERIVGPIALAAVYLVSGLLAALVSLAAAPVTTSVGASGAVFGIYGLLLAVSAWGMMRPSDVTPPLLALQRIAPAAAVFAVFNAIDGSLPIAAELAGLATGLVCGLVLTWRIGDRVPENRMVGAVAASAAVAAVISAASLAGVSDVRPELTRILSTEQSTAEAYRSALQKLRDGRMTAEALAEFIDATIVPQLEAATIRLQALDRVPAEHQPLIAEAGDYLKLRAESWRLRVESLRERRRGAADGRLRAETEYRASLVRRGKADGAERASLEALERLALSVSSRCPECAVSDTPAGERT